MPKRQTNKSSFKPKDALSTTRPLELLHLDLFSPIKTQSLGGKKYGMVIVDDYSRFSWVLFLAHKDGAFDLFKTFCKRIQNEMTFLLFLLEVIMEKNLKINILNPFVKKIVSHITFLFQGLN